MEHFDPAKTRSAESLDLPYLLKSMQAIVGQERASTAQADRTLHARDQSSSAEHLPEAVVWPRTTAEISAILRHANEEGWPVTAWGAGTSLEGNPIPVCGGLVLNLQQMNKILCIHDTDFQVTVQPGLFYKDMNRLLARYGLFFAPDPGANASIGGMIANNAAGIRTVKYGATKDNVLALEVVLASGEVVRTGSRSIKQSSGYDLTHLFVGSEGTLGIVSEATLKLAPLPDLFSAVVAAFATVEQAAQVVFNIIGTGLEPSALEFLNTHATSLINAEDGIELFEAPNLIMEFSGASEASLRDELDLVETICREYNCRAFQAGLGREARNKLWRARHDFFEILLRAYPGHDYLLTDVAVPISQYPALVAAADEIMSELQVQGAMVGHAGDGNLHTSVFFLPEDRVGCRNAQMVNDHLVEQALALDGTSTGEHGVGLGKQKYMLQEHGEASLTLMRQLKATLDPNGILNPGKVLAL
jgi:D-lactate dehydrogenase (cytochrome)